MNSAASIGDSARSVIESLAERLARSVALVDASLSPVYISRHYGDQDQARIQSMLQREPSADIRRYLFEQGVTRWRHTDMLEGNDELGLKARLCVPLHGPGWLIGFLMIVDADRQLNDAQISEITSVGQGLAVLLHADSLAADHGLAEDALKTRQLLDPTDPAHGRAVVAISQAVAGDHPITTVSVIHVDAPRKASIPAEVALRIVLDSITRVHRAEHHFYVEASTAVLLHLSPRPSNAAELRANHEGLAADLHRLLGPSATVAIGVGRHDGGLDDSWQAYGRARTALRAATRRPLPSAIVLWHELGIDSLLLEIPEEALTWSLVPPAVQHLVRVDDNGKLVNTLRTYLDHSCSVSRTAEALHLHRTSLYYRLDQIRAATGADLEDGRTRLILHAGLHLLDLIADSD